MFTVEDYMVNDLNLSGNFLLVFALLCGEGVCEYTNTELCEKVGLKSVNTLKSVLRSLEEKGLICVTQNGNRANTIEVLHNDLPASDRKVNPKNIMRKKFNREQLD